MASSLHPGNPKRIVSFICDSSLIFKPVIDLPLFGPTFPEEFIAFAVNEKMCYAVCVVAIYTFTIWFYLYIFEPFIER